MVRKFILSAAALATLAIGVGTAAHADAYVIGIGTTPKKPPHTRVF